MEQKKDKPWGPLEHALTGAGVGAAGVGNSAAIIGASTAVAVLPVAIAVGVVGGLAWWAAKKIASD